MAEDTTEGSGPELLRPHPVSLTMLRCRTGPSIFALCLLRLSGLRRKLKNKSALSYSPERRFRRWAEPTPA